MKKLIQGMFFIASVYGISKFFLYVIKEKKKNTRSAMYYNVMGAWLDAIFNDERIGEWLRKKGHQKIAIYGKGTLGILLWEELSKEGFEIPCFIDASAKDLSVSLEGIPVVTLEDAIEQQNDMDAIIVTPVHVADLICRDIYNSKMKVDVYRLDEIFEMIQRDRNTNSES